MAETWLWQGSSTIYLGSLAVKDVDFIPRARGFERSLTVEKWKAQIADMQSTGRLHVLIAGAGIGGLSAAIALRQQGHVVDVRLDSFTFFFFLG